MQITGPKISLKKECHDCKHLVSKCYTHQSDSGVDYYCGFFDTTKPVTPENTPGWCPYIEYAVDKFVEERLS